MTEGHQNQVEGCLTWSSMLGLVGFLQINQLKHLFFSSPFGFNQCKLSKLERSTLFVVQVLKFSHWAFFCFVSVCLFSLKRGLSESVVRVPLKSFWCLQYLVSCQSRVKRKHGGGDTGICSKRCAVPDIHLFIYSFEFYIFFIFWFHIYFFIYWKDLVGKLWTSWRKAMFNKGK